MLRDAPKELRETYKENCEAGLTWWEDAVAEAWLLVRLGFGYDVDTVTIGVLMVLVPGVALTNAMREIMAGDIISGLSRTADAILVASAIALGTVVGLAIGQMF